ncbi:dynein light chain Tctex-type protein 2B-like [Cylas formicarius]|uniref:dynein light chain Tctex-type protein 2B-like n=1 Tax=Cylas formicarius TaxID=197179 RepID=UPI00295882F2|nr:dynein light chain Tctex-type protein 2B-like [Cylas formicarius]
MENVEKRNNINPENATTPSLGTKIEELPDAAQQQSYESVGPLNTYQIKPNLQEKFKELPVKEIIKEVQAAVLGGKQYDPEQVKKWTIRIANDVNQKVKELEMKRYKHIAQVIIGEKKGQGIKAGVRCLWDADVDGTTSEIFMNDTIFCVTTVFAIYLY